MRSKKVGWLHTCTSSLLMLSFLYPVWHFSIKNKFCSFSLCSVSFFPEHTALRSVAPFRSLLPFGLLWREQRSLFSSRLGFAGFDPHQGSSRQSEPSEEMNLGENQTWMCFYIHIMFALAKHALHHKVLVTISHKNISKQWRVQTNTHVCTPTSLLVTVGAASRPQNVLNCGDKGEESARKKKIMK